MSGGKGVLAVHFLARAASLAAAACLSGCEVGPDFLRPTAPDVAGYTPETLSADTTTASIHGGEAQHFVSDLDIPGQWWTLFQSEPLNALIEQALKANPSLGSAAAAPREGQE